MLYPPADTATVTATALSLQQPMPETYLQTAYKDRERVKVLGALPPEIRGQVTMQGRAVAGQGLVGPKGAQKEHAAPGAGRGQGRRPLA